MTRWNQDIHYLKKYGNPEIFDENVEKLKAGIPVQYLVGNVDFYGTLFHVDKRVLIPRFETEELVEKTARYIKKGFHKDVSIIDLGTGSGCIAITLKKIFPESEVMAVDISKDALEVAKGNALKNQVDIHFQEGDMLENVQPRFDVIVSNPPYIAYTEEIMDIVKNHEPHLALYAEKNGLSFYEQILKSCSKNLNEKFLIAFEIGSTQGKAIELLAHQYLSDIEVKIEKDLQGLDRFVFIMNF